MHDIGSRLKTQNLLCKQSSIYHPQQQHNSQTCLTKVRPGCEPEVKHISLLHHTCTCHALHSREKYKWTCEQNLVVSLSHPCKRGGQELGSRLEKGCTLQLQLCAKLHSASNDKPLFLGHCLSPGTECMCMNCPCAWMVHLYNTALLHPLFSGHEMLHTL